MSTRYLIKNNREVLIEHWAPVGDCAGKKIKLCEVEEQYRPSGVCVCMYVCADIS